MSTSTVRRRLYEGGLYSRQPAISMPLTSRYRRDRLQWVRQHIHWMPDEWRAFLFTNKSRFSLESDSRRYLIWREPWTRYYPSNIRERDTCGRGSFCVWGGISSGGSTNLHVFPRRTVNTEVYRDDIVDAYVGPYDGAVSNVFLLQEENARPHGLASQMIIFNRKQFCKWCGQLSPRTWILSSIFGML